MSSSVTIDWRAVRERERQACLALRAELAQLQAREKQLRLRSAAVTAAHGRLRAEIYHVGRPGSAADSAELSRLLSEARAGLDRSGVALDEAIGSASRARGAAAAAEWTTSSGTQMAPMGQPAPTIKLENLSREASHQPASPARESYALLRAEADAVIEECRLRCPETNQDELTRLRAGMGTNLLRDRATIQDLRVLAARTIQQVKRGNELEEQRQRLFILAEDATEPERAVLRRRIADAPPEDMPRLDGEVTAAVHRASTQRAQAEAVSALEQSLRELNYDVQSGFESLLPFPAVTRQRAGKQPAAACVVAASPHSANHGLRIRAGNGQLYVSVVRRAGTGKDGDAQRTDTNVQQLSCRDLERAAARAVTRGVQLVLGNAQAPGRPAPEVAADCWPASASSAETHTATERQAEAAPGRLDEESRRQAWTAQEQQRTAIQQQARAKRPTP